MGLGEGAQALGTAVLTMPCVPQHVLGTERVGGGHAHLGQLPGTLARGRAWRPGNSPAAPSCPPVPSAPPRKVEAEALNATAIRVLWRSPTPGRQHGQIRGYQVHYVRMEGAEARGPPRIKDIMLADAQVGGHGWGGRGARALSPLCFPSRCRLPSHVPPLSLATASRSVGDGRHCRICK